MIGSRIFQFTFCLLRSIFKIFVAVFRGPGRESPWVDHGQQVNADFRDFLPPAKRGLASQASVGK